MFEIFVYSHLCNQCIKTRWAHTICFSSICYSYDIIDDCRGLTDCLSVQFISNQNSDSFPFNIELTFSLTLKWHFHCFTILPKKMSNLFPLKNNKLLDNYNLKKIFWLYEAFSLQDWCCALFTTRGWTTFSTWQSLEWKKNILTLLLWLRKT